MDVVAPQRFGRELRQWRIDRRLSQLELATSAEVSQKHISYLELGRSRPSREMVDHLGRALGLSIRRRNELLLAAGFAPTVSEHKQDAIVAELHGALAALIDAQDPMPSFVVDRAWNVVLANRAAIALVDRLLPPERIDLASNVARLFFHPEGARRRLVNPDATARQLRERLQRELIHDPDNDALAKVLDEADDFPPGPQTSEHTSGAAEIIHFRLNDHDERYYMTLGAMVNPQHALIEELQIETLVPADSATREALPVLLNG